MPALKIGILEEGKIPADERVAFTPLQCKEILSTYNCEIYLQRSKVRRIPDSEYVEAGLNLVNDVSHCDVFFGIKEVPKVRLIRGKTYFFFSHTIKKQTHNRELLQKLLEKKIRMIDYECLTDERHLRVLGFGRFAGLVGAYNGLRMIGMKKALFRLKKAHDCKDQMEMHEEIKKVKLPPIKICMTGKGRVSSGALEILREANIREVSIQEYLNDTFNEAVFVQLDVTDYNRKKDGSEGEMFEFFNHPDLYEANFMRFAACTDFYIASHFWDSKAPRFYSKEDMASADFRITYIADISCDIDGPLASTLRSSTIEDPFYGVNKQRAVEVDFMEKDCIAVMAVDNLPCELPVDASKDFGEQLMKHVVPRLFGQDEGNMLKRATMVQDGKLMPDFQYLQDFANGK
jgi:hypothetical protein